MIENNDDNDDSPTTLHDMYGPEEENPYDARQRTFTRSTQGLPHYFRDEYQEFATAIHFLTVSPFPPSIAEEQEEEQPYMIVGSGYFPLVGFLLALLLSLLCWGLGSLLPLLALAALLVVADVVLTGGLHLDGLMDTCDGCFGGRTIERKLEIMRDSRVGSFGVLGGVCVLLLKFALLASLEARLLPIVLFITLPVARWGMVLVVRSFPSVHSSGLGYEFRRSVTNGRVVLAAVFSLTIALLAGHIVGMVAWVLATVVALGLGSWIARLLGGLTGDTYGAIEEVVEVLILLVLVLLRGWL